MNGIKKYASQYKIKATGEVWEAALPRKAAEAGGFTMFVTYREDPNVRAVQLVDPQTLEIRTFLLHGLEPVDGEY